MLAYKRILRCLHKGLSPYPNRFIEQCFLKRSAFSVILINTRQIIAAAKKNYFLLKTFIYLLVYIMVYLLRGTRSSATTLPKTATSRY